MDILLNITYIILCCLVFVGIVLLIMDFSEVFIHKIKDKFLSTKVRYYKQEYMHGVDYMKEVERSDGYIVERYQINEFEYLRYMRKLKLKNIIADA